MDQENGNRKSPPTDGGDKQSDSSVPAAAAGQGKAKKLRVAAIPDPFQMLLSKLEDGQDEGVAISDIDDLLQHDEEDEKTGLLKLVQALAKERKELVQQNVEKDNKNKELVQQKEELVQQNVEKDNKNKELVQQKEELVQQNVEKDNKNKELVQQKEELVQQNVEKDNKNKELVQQKEELVQQNVEKDNKNKELVQQKEELVQQNVEKDNKNKELVQQKEELVQQNVEKDNKNKELVQQKEELVQQNVEKDNKNKELVQQKEELVQQNVEKDNKNKELVQQKEELVQQNVEKDNKNKELVQQKEELVQQNVEKDNKNKELVQQKEELVQQNVEKDNKNKELVQQKEELVQQNVEKDEKIVEKDNKNKELVQENEQLVQENEQLVQQRKEQAQKMKEERNLLARSIENVYYHSYGTPKQKLRLPPINVDLQIKPSVHGHETKAEIVPSEFPVKSQLIPTREREVEGSPEVYKIASSIALDNNMTKDGKIRYMNEIDVQCRCKELVQDMIRCLGLQNLLNVHMEISLYGKRPDILVVSWNGKVVFCVEVKAPETKQGEVFESGIVAGQIFDYLMTMKQLGVPHPLGAIMTYNGIRIVSLENFQENHELEEAAEEGGGDVVTQRSEMPKETKEAASPQKERISIKDVVAKDNETVVDESGYIAPKVYGSQTFWNDDVPLALFLALKVAFSQHCENTLVKLPIVKPQDNIGSRIFAKVTEKGLKFYKLSSDFPLLVNEPAGSTSKVFYLLAQLGRGSAGEVYLACNSVGRLCAIKLYPHKRSYGATEEERKKEHAKELTRVQEIRDKELKNWKKLFPKMKHVKEHTLNGLPALQMPYLRQLETNVQERSNCLADIKSELERYAAENLMYKSMDLRWHHVCKFPSEDGSDSIILVDLELLEKIVDNRENLTPEKRMEVVDSQIQALLSCP